MRRSALASIASYIVETRGSVISGQTRDAALRCLFDLIVAAAAGHEDRGPLAVRRAVGLMGQGEVPVWFSGVASSPLGAAWANSAAASAQDLDDGHRLARGHPGAVVIPTVIPIGQAQKASWEQMLTAIVIGYEVGITIAAARRSYGNTGTWGAYAAVAAAGALCGTSAAVLEHALAIAGETAPNQLFASAPPPRDPSPEGSDVKEGIPWSVVTGLTALRLAEAGHTGPRNILESVRHYDLPDPIRFGGDAHINHVYHKLYACCRHVHAPLDALLGLIADHDLADADAITVETTSGALRISNLARPSNLTDVQYSIPYCLSLAMVRGQDGLMHLRQDVLNDHAVETLAQRVSLVLNPSFDARFPQETLARVTVRSRGRDVVSPITAPRGEASDPLTWCDLRKKAKVVSESLGAPLLGKALDDLAVNLSANRLTGLSDLVGCNLDQMAVHP
ncbi:MmgE/PrpD family protein [Paracoccus haematequi]|uniref:MmgE/PrpD family protein n=1 Tax=Paracoccus haematequi TaxID=2491866 RepID=A0A3S4DYT8_9RHOB|nr:MmgE/PrpD family protein [Paracoccus haematequi]VDS10569.1 MmgE/PrpD family protein [Paracoccus haematequi]